MSGLCVRVSLRNSVVVLGLTDMAMAKSGKVHAPLHKFLYESTVLLSSLLSNFKEELGLALHDHFEGSPYPVDSAGLSASFNDC